MGDQDHANLAGGWAMLAFTQGCRPGRLLPIELRSSDAGHASVFSRQEIGVGARFELLKGTTSLPGARGHVETCAPDGDGFAIGLAFETAYANAA